MFGQILWLRYRGLKCNGFLPISFLNIRKFALTLTMEQHFEIARCERGICTVSSTAKSGQLVHIFNYSSRHLLTNFVVLPLRYMLTALYHCISARVDDEAAIGVYSFTVPNSELPRDSPLSCVHMTEGILPLLMLLSKAYLFL